MKNTILISSLILFGSFAHAKIIYNPINSCESVSSGEESTAYEEIPFYYIEKMTRINEFEMSIGVKVEDQTDFYLQTLNGRPVRTKLVGTIYHGLLNSPSYTRWVAEDISAMGVNVINARLPKHNTGDAESLNTISVNDFTAHVALMLEVAEVMGSNLIHVGHSAGGLSASYAAMTNINTIGLVNMAPAFQVTDSIYWPSYTLGRTPLSNRLVNLLSSDVRERYLSLASGRTTDRFSNLFRDAPGIEGDLDIEYGLLIQRLRPIAQNIIWADVEGDTTISHVVNQRIVSHIPGVDYLLIPASSGLAHVGFTDNPETSDYYATDEARQAIRSLYRTHVFPLFERLK